MDLSQQKATQPAPNEPSTAVADSEAGERDKLLTHPSAEAPDPPAVSAQQQMEGGVERGAVEAAMMAAQPHLLSLSSLVILIFFEVSGGPFGTEVRGHDHAAVCYRTVCRRCKVSRAMPCEQHVSACAYVCMRWHVLCRCSSGFACAWFGSIHRRRLRTGAVHHVTYG